MGYKQAEFDKTLFRFANEAVSVIEHTANFIWYGPIHGKIWYTANFI